MKRPGDGTLLMIVAAMAILLAVATLCTGCHARIAVHYVPDEQGNLRAACRFWDGTLILQSQTVTGCYVTSPYEVEHQPHENRALAMIRAWGWEEEDTGGDELDVDAGGGVSTVGVDGQAQDQARTTTAGEVQIPVVAGGSGMAYASRTDDIGIRTGRVLRWLTAFWGAVQIAGEAFGFGEATLTD